MYSRLTDEQIDEMYSYRAISDYVKVENPDEWLTCKGCGVKPRVWRFNNGSHATCLCFEKYDAHPARSESVMSVFKRTGLTAEYKPDNLRLAWNRYVETGEMQNKLSEGCW